MAWELPFDQRFDEQNDCGGGGKLSRHFSENTYNQRAENGFLA
jgi:hypothetical protein